MHTYTHIHTQTHTRTHTRTRRLACIHAHTHTHTYTHKHKDTHTHTGVKKKPYASPPPTPPRTAPPLPEMVLADYVCMIKTRHVLCTVLYINFLFNYTLGLTPPGWQTTRVCTIHHRKCINRETSAQYSVVWVLILYERMNSVLLLPLGCWLAVPTILRVMVCLLLFISHLILLMPHYCQRVVLAGLCVHVFQRPWCVCLYLCDI